MNQATGGEHEMDRLKLHQTLEHIKHQHDLQVSVENMTEDLNGVLSGLGIIESFTGAEREVLMQELTEIALQQEFAEAARLAFRDPELSWA